MVSKSSCSGTVTPTSVDLFLIIECSCSTTLVLEGSFVLGFILGFLFHLGNGGVKGSM